MRFCQEVLEKTNNSPFDNISNKSTDLKRNFQFCPIHSFLFIIFVNFFLSHEVLSWRAGGSNRTNRPMDASFSYE